MKRPNRRDYQFEHRPIVQDGKVVKTGERFTKGHITLGEPELMWKAGGQFAYIRAMERYIEWIHSEAEQSEDARDFIKMVLENGDTN